MKTINKYGPVPFYIDEYHDEEKKKSNGSLDRLQGQYYNCIFGQDPNITYVGTGFQ